MSKTYAFQYKNKAIDLLKLHMYSMYTNPLSICNVIFTFSMVALLFRFWFTAHIVIKVILILLICFFPVFQPTLIYRRYKNSEHKFDYFVDLKFDNNGFDIKFSNLDNLHYSWNDVLKITKKYGIICVTTSDKRDHPIPNKVFDGNKLEFYEFIKSKIS